MFALRTGMRAPTKFLPHRRTPLISSSMWSQQQTLAGISAHSWPAKSMKGVSLALSKIVPVSEVPRFCTATLRTSPSLRVSSKGTPGCPAGTPMPAAVWTLGVTLILVPSITATALA